MMILEPHNIDYSTVVSSIPEDTAEVWTSTKTYAKEAIVRYGIYLYTSLQDSNTNHQPSTTLSGLDAWWKRTTVTNRGAAFDAALYTQSVAPEGTTEITISFPWARGATGFGLLNMTGVTNVNIKVVDGSSTIVYNQDFNLLDGVDNWWDYYAGLWDYKSDLTEFTSIPLVSGTFTATLTGGEPAIGHIMVGETWTLGKSLRNATAEIKDFSVYNTDDFGNTTVIQRSFAKTYNIEVSLDLSKADSTFKRLTNIRAKSCLWRGDDVSLSDGGLDFLIAFGYFKRAPLTAQSASTATYNLEIEGLI